MARYKVRNNFFSFLAPVNQKANKSHWKPILFFMKCNILPTFIIDQLYTCTYMKTYKMLEMTRTKYVLLQTSSPFIFQRGFVATKHFRRAFLLHRRYSRSVYCIQISLKPCHWAIRIAFLPLTFYFVVFLSFSLPLASVYRIYEL